MTIVWLISSYRQVWGIAMVEATRKLVKHELFRAIAFFIERQQLVAQAMLDLGLDLQFVSRFGALGWITSDSHTVKHVDKSRDLVDLHEAADTMHVPQSGVWRDGDQNEWRYFLHGGGCLLTNRITKEPIDWDCPNRLAFDSGFFCRHLAWQLKAPNRQDKLKHTRNWVQELNSMGRKDGCIDIQVMRLLEEMVNDGLVNKDWTLAKQQIDSEDDVRSWRS